MSTIRTLCTSFAAAALMTGCAGMRGEPMGSQPDYGPTAGTTAACSRTTTIRIRRPSLGATPPTIEVSTRTAHILKGNTPRVRWLLEPNDLEFLTDGITFKPGSPAGPVSPPTWAANQFEWCFASTNDSTWEYNIRFKTTGEKPASYECDPTIVNASGFMPLAWTPVNCTRLP